MLHIYEKDGKKYPSVTTIIHSIGSEELMKWSNIMGFRHRKIEDILEETSKFGTLVHSHLQEIVDPEHGKPLAPKDAIEEYELLQLKSRFKRYISDYTYETISTERTLISDKMGYAGTLDWLAWMGPNKDIRMLNDFKTSKRVQVSMIFQLGGYFNLLKEVGEEPDGGSIVIINKTTCKLNPFDHDMLETAGRIFLSLKDWYIESSQIQVSPSQKLLERLTS